MGLHDPGRPLVFRRAAILLLRDLINRSSGIYYDDEKLDILADKLADRVIELGLPDYDEYYYHLRYDPAGDAEWASMMDAITVKETYFLREVDQLRACAEVLVPRLLARRNPSRLAIWSAACATGEEPYSLAMLLSDKGLSEKVEIVASDVSRRALKQAQRGIYSERSLRAMPETLRECYMRKRPEGWEVVAKLREQVSFRPLNLLDAEAMSSMQKFDVIFCRNAFIYFDPGSMKRVVDGFHRLLKDEGVLFVGAAESLVRITESFELVEMGGAFGYQKC